MILPEKLNQIAQKSQTSLLNISRDYLQALFLTGFYQQKKSSIFFFKGGTALHFIYQSPRFSEDLDFSARAFNCRVFEDLLTQSLLFVEKNGLPTELVESKPTTGGCLAIFSTLVGDLSVRIQIEVSLRAPRKLKGEVFLVRTEFLPPFNLLALDQKTMIQGKIKALLTRKEPRDFYDLYFILRLGWKIDLSSQERIAIAKEIEVIDPRQMAEDLREFLPKSHCLIIRDLPAALKGELEKGG